MRNFLDAYVFKILPPNRNNIENGILNCAAMSGGNRFFSYLGIVWILDYMNQILD